MTFNTYSVLKDQISQNKESDTLFFSHISKKRNILSEFWKNVDCYTPRSLIEGALLYFLHVKQNCVYALNGRFEIKNESVYSMA
jgi:hypothetical protein